MSWLPIAADFRVDSRVALDQAKLSDTHYRATHFNKLWVGSVAAAIGIGRQTQTNRQELLGIAFNVAFLGYFKYIDFGPSAINDIFAANLVLTHVVPLGISFITFQKIAFLIDVHAGR
jgi:D-alanyl-lipoteichoic acid acyltransferase DltB (MBOAT superfamily)